MIGLAKIGAPWPTSRYQSGQLRRTPLVDLHVYAFLGNHPDRWRKEAGGGQVTAARGRMPVAADADRPATACTLLGCSHTGEWAAHRR